MSQALKFRFRWRANGQDHATVVEAPDYPLACYKLASHHAMLFPPGHVPSDLEIDLRKPERVEE